MLTRLDPEMILQVLYSMNDNVEAIWNAGPAAPAFDYFRPALWSLHDFSFFGSLQVFNHCHLVVDIPTLVSFEIGCEETLKLSVNLIDFDDLIRKRRKNKIKEN